jgi:hypothetical protein
MEGKIRKNLENLVREYGLDSSGSGKIPAAGSCESGYEHSGSIKGEEFLQPGERFNL